MKSAEKDIDFKEKIGPLSANQQYFDVLQTRNEDIQIQQQPPKYAVEAMKEDGESVVSSVLKSMIQSIVLGNSSNSFLHPHQQLFRPKSRETMETDLKPCSWICCDVCSKWRRVPEGISLPSQDVEWKCELNNWDKYNQCWIDEEPSAADEFENEEINSSVSFVAEEEIEHLGHGHLGDKRYKEELAIIDSLGVNCQSVWVLPNCRIISWIEDKPYALAHSGETIADIALEFHFKVSDVSIVNAALHQRVPGTSAFLAEGTTVLLPWLEDDTQKIWHVLTSQLLTDGWKIEWVQGLQGDKTTEKNERLVYFPPKVEENGNTQGSFNPQYYSLEGILSSHPLLLETFDFATQLSASNYLKRLTDGTSKNALFESLIPIFSVGDWVLGQWPEDNQWIFAKIKACHEDSTYDLEYEDGEIEIHKRPIFIKGLDLIESYQPRSTTHGRLYWSDSKKEWVAYYQGLIQINGKFGDDLQKAEAALEDHYAKYALDPHIDPIEWSEIKTVAASSQYKCRSTWVQGKYGDGASFCSICLENTSSSYEEPVLLTFCCQNWFHKSCLDLQPKLQCGKLSCPSCSNSDTFHSQLRASRWKENFYPSLNRESRQVMDDDFRELNGRFIWTNSKETCGVVKAIDRFGRLVLKHLDGSLLKARPLNVEMVSIDQIPEFWISVPFKTGPVWKTRATPEFVIAQSEAKRFELEKGSPKSPVRKILGSRRNRNSDSSEAMTQPILNPQRKQQSPQITKGVGQGYANNIEPANQQWICELCDWVNEKFVRRCSGCSQGSQARSMIGRHISTTNGPGRVAKSSGKGWVVVDTERGGSYRMRLSQIWDYIVPESGSASQTISGNALALPVHRAGDPGMPKNWSFSLLKKRVQTNQGAGVVTDVIDKGWIGVRLENGRKVKTRPGNVTALEGDEVITTFAKKTKATHAIRQPLLVHSTEEGASTIGDEPVDSTLLSKRKRTSQYFGQSVERGFYDDDNFEGEEEEENQEENRTLPGDGERMGDKKGIHKEEGFHKEASTETSTCPPSERGADALLLAAQHLFNHY